MTSRTTLSCLIILLVLITSVPLVNAATVQGRWNNSRDLDPVIVTGLNIFGLTGVPVNQLYVYTYNASQDSWQPIPFQIDEKDNTLDVWLTNPDGIFNGNDELVFMAKDMGDRAPDGSYWIDDPVSQSYERVEITVEDTVANKQAWVYVYRSTNPLPLSPDSYVGYIPGPAGSAGADTVIAMSYVEAHSPGGIPTDWVLKDGTGIDILDRQKARIGLLLYGWVDFRTNEAFIEQYLDTVKVKAGPVRIIREVVWHIDIGFGINPFDFNLPLVYYAYSIESGGVSGNLSTNDHVYLIRQSFDLNENAIGMKLYNPYNRGGILIDGMGQSDGVVDVVLDSPEVNWWLVTGDQGSYAIIFSMSQIGDQRNLYYFDDSTKLGEAEDTGDFRSYGDTGINITGTDIAGNISFAYKAYYMGPNKNDSFGDSLAANFQSPMKTSTQTNTWFPVELAFFNGVASDGNVVLEWATESETNNFEFQIQRKTEGELNWEKIGSVNGQGTTTTPHKYSFTDQHVEIGSYYYRLKQVDFDGSFEFSDEILVMVAAPKTFSLEQNYPNPFNPETVIRYRIPELDQASVAVELKIYNLLGDVVRTLVQKDQGAGYYSVSWDGRNERGDFVAAGTYLYQLRAGHFIRTNKMLLLR